MRPVPADNADDANDQKISSEGDVKEEQRKSAAAEAEIAAVAANDPKNLDKDMQQKPKAVCREICPLDLDDPGDVKQKRQYRSPQKESWVFIHGQQRKCNQKDMHDQGRKVNVLHNMPPFGYIIQE